jgi:hypothetical protein
MRFLILISLILVSCGGFPIPEDRERCIVDIEHERCTCLTYHVGPDYVGNLKGAEPIEMEFTHCHKLVGFTPDNLAGLSAWFKKIFIWLKAKKII